MAVESVENNFQHDKSKVKSGMHDVFITFLLYVSKPNQYPSKECHHQMEYLLYNSVIVKFSWWQELSLAEQVLIGSVHP